MVEQKIEDFDFDVFENTKLKMKESEEYKRLVEMYDSRPVRVPEVGQVVKATFSGITPNYYLFSVDGYKDFIRVDNRTSESKYLRSIEAGDVIEVLIANVNNTNYHITGSVCEIYETQAHQNLKSLDKNIPVFATVKSSTPAGYTMDVLYNGVVLPGFMPNTLAGINKLHNPESIVGEKFEVMIESYSNGDGTYIVSRRRYLQTLIPAEIEKLEFGKVYGGIVTGATSFGVFVEFNECLTGMVYKANISKSWQNKIDQIKPGFEIDFFIKEILNDKRGPKIILTQTLEETLWDTIQPGQTIEGVVKDVKRFGTLVYLDDQTTGLIHISEMEKINKKFDSGDNIDVRVLAVDRPNRKIFLTLK